MPTFREKSDVYIPTSVFRFFMSIRLEFPIGKYWYTGVVARVSMMLTYFHSFYGVRHLNGLNCYSVYCCVIKHRDNGSGFF